MRNNPIRYRDPSGHDACDEEGNCYSSDGWYRAPGFPRLSTIETWKIMIRSSFGVVIIDDKVSWSGKNLSAAYNSLKLIDNNLNGSLKNMISGTKFTMTDGGNQYYGMASLSGEGVAFHVANASIIVPEINFLHETGHLLDLVPNSRRIFSDPLRQNKPNWIDDDGYVDRTLLLDKFSEPVQAKPMNEPFDPYEYWADAFANFMAGNIDLSDPIGQEMYKYVNDALSPFISP